MNATAQGGAEGGRGTHVLPGLREAWVKWVLVAVALLLLGLAVFGPMLGDFFWLDDLTWINAARHISPAALLPAAFLPNSQFPYRPLASLTFGALVPLCGCEPAAYRTVGLALHIVNSLLAYAFVQRLTRNGRLALVGALTWLIYPVHRWAVLWIADLAGVLLVTFTLASLLFFWRYLDIARMARPHAFRYYVLALAAFALALMSKESSITIAFLFPILEWVSHDEAAPKEHDRFRIALRYLPFFLLTCVYTALVGIAYRQRPGAESYDLLALRSVENLGKAVIFLVDPFIPYNTLNTMRLRAVVAAAGAIAVLWGLIVWRWGRREGWFLTAWVVVALAPVTLAASFLAPFRGRYLYLASIGYLLLLACLVKAVVNDRLPTISGPATDHRPLTTALLAIALIGLGAFNVGQQALIRNDLISALRRWTWGGIMGCPATEALRARERPWGEADFRWAAQGFDRLEAQVKPNAIDKLSRGLAYELTGDRDRAAADYEAGLALVPATGFDSRSVGGGAYVPYADIAAYVQARLDALGRQQDSSH